MKVLKILLSTSVLFFYQPVLAKRQEPIRSVKPLAQPKKAVVKVHGMVCAFCAQGLETHFAKNKKVRSIKVDLDKMEVVLNLKSQKLAEKEVKKAIEDSGFQFVEMKYE